MKATPTLQFTMYEIDELSMPAKRPELSDKSMNIPSKKRKRVARVWQNGKSQGTEDPGHAVWGQYLKQKHALSPLERTTVKNYFQSEDNTYISYILVMRKCRWLTAMHDRAEQCRENSPRFPRLIGVISSSAQFYMNSDQPLRVMDTFLEIIKMSMHYYALTLAPHMNEDELWTRIQTYMQCFDSSALKISGRLLHTIEQVRVMIQRHFPGATRNDFTPSKNSIVSFLFDVRDAEFPGPLTDDINHGEAQSELNTWLVTERLFTLADELLRNKRTSSGNVEVGKPESFIYSMAWASNHFKGLVKERLVQSEEALDIEGIIRDRDIERMRAREVLH
ncbi:hypothetical protein BDZ91DRAFT_766769 [Kalaharituber pfeilii]|nr:hypothetical protein BDZ91DRAFT_766769 [Kalaharituber pfeilii]